MVPCLIYHYRLIDAGDRHLPEDVAEDPKQRHPHAKETGQTTIAAGVIELG
jgi:hypothetical protein